MEPTPLVSTSWRTGSVLISSSVASVSIESSSLIVLGGRLLGLVLTLDLRVVLQTSQLAIWTDDDLITRRQPLRNFDVVLASDTSLHGSKQGAIVANEEDSLRKLLVFLDRFGPARRWRRLRRRRGSLAITLALDQRLHGNCQNIILAVSRDC